MYSNAIDSSQELVKQGSTSRRRSHISNINMLPPEILGDIFTYCLPPFTYEGLKGIDRSSLSSRAPIINPRTAPLLLLKICRHWREVALGTPALFTRIFLHGGHLAVDPTIIVPMWLSHSKALPIDIVIEPDAWSIRVTTKEIKDIFTEISRNVHRLRSFRCTVGSFLAPLFPSGMALKVERLENLALFEVRKHRAMVIGRPLHIGTVIAPRLRSFETDFVSRSLYFVSPAGPFLQVYINKGADQNLSQLAIMLQNSPNIQICRLETAITTARDRLEWESVELSLPFLRELSIASSKRYDDLSPFLNSLRLSRLDVLRLSWDGICTPEEFRCSLQSMFPDSRGSNLRVLHLRSFPLLDVSIPSPLLGQFVALKEFLVDIGRINGHEIIRALQSWEYCPNLAYFHLHLAEVSGDDLITMLRRRTGTEGGIPEFGSPLQRITVRYCRGLSPLNDDQLRHLREEHPEIVWNAYVNEVP